MGQRCKEWPNSLFGENLIFSFIPIELLSEIYEIFLNKTDKQRSDSGEYYTPYSLVDLVLNEFALG